MQRIEQRRTWQETLTWLAGRPSLDELRAAHPEEWDRASRRLRVASEGGRQGISVLIGEVSADQARGDRLQPRPARLSSLVERHMVVEALRGVSDRVESGVEEGDIRFRRFDGFVLQRVLFARGLVRKPVRLAQFRVAWFLSRQRNRLMPLVRPKGIYCFYSARAVAGLARTIGGRSAVEIGAGDGTLTRFLRQRSVPIVATDDFSWSRSIDYPGDVERADARTALRTHEPQVVLCCWPPAGNRFEEAVFRTPSVQTYIVITSRDEREAGAWNAYRQQQGFTMEEDQALGRLVLPPGRNRVLVFTRR